MKAVYVKAWGSALTYMFKTLSDPSLFQDKANTSAWTLLIFRWDTIYIYIYLPSNLWSWLRSPPNPAAGSEVCTICTVHTQSLFLELQALENIVLLQCCGSLILHSTSTCAHQICSIILDRILNYIFKDVKHTFYLFIYFNNFGLTGCCHAPGCCDKYINK